MTQGFPFDSTIAKNETNNFGLLRLLFATLVLVSHSFEIVDGNRIREPLTVLFNSISLGELSVDAFFALSGFLIVKSWRQRPALTDFLIARVLRIYPGFALASLLCAFLVGPLGSGSGHYFEALELSEYFFSAITLRGPSIPPVFEGSHYPFVNNSLWTIKYEMACYLFVALFGVLGLARRPIFWCLTAAFMCALFTIVSALPLFDCGRSCALPDPLKSAIRLFTFFAVGATYQVCQFRVRFTLPRACLATVLLFPLMSITTIAEPALAVFGSYLLFSTAFSHSGLLRALAPRIDISFGIYLYAWPVQKLLVLYFPQTQPAGVLLWSLAASAMLGWLSWHAIESPAMSLKHKMLRT
jgi:peptidoglycan/LPS O-acetylase OafA/YrhL